MLKWTVDALGAGPEAAYSASNGPTAMALLIIGFVTLCAILLICDAVNKAADEAERKNK